MSRKKTTDPRLVALLDKQEKLRADCERSYQRMRRAFNRLEKTRQALNRLGKRIDAFRALQNGV